jgi:hypothetical protein
MIGTSPRMIAANLARRLRGDDFLVFVHPVGEIDRMLVDRGFRRLALRHTVIWHVALYAAGEPAC